MSLTARALLLLPVILLFVPLTIADLWGTWVAELVLGLVALLLLGVLTAAVRMMLLRVVPERHTQLLEPWNWDIAWQALVVAGSWLFLAM